MSIKTLLGTAIKEDLKILKIDHVNKVFALTDGQNKYLLSFKHAEESDAVIEVKDNNTVLSCKTWRRAGENSVYLRTDKQTTAKLDVNSILEGL